MIYASLNCQISARHRLGHFDGGNAWFDNYESDRNVGRISVGLICMKRRCSEGFFWQPTPGKPSLGRTLSVYFLVCISDKRTRLTLGENVLT